MTVAIDIKNLVTDRKELQDLFGSTPTMIGDELSVDVLIRESPVFDAEVGEHSLQAGLDATDNRVKRPVGVVLQGILTNTELSLAATFDAVLSEAPLEFVSWQEKRDLFMGIHHNSQIVDITTPDWFYPNMQLISLRGDITGDNSENSFFFTAEFREANIVSTQVIEIDEALIPKRKKKKKKKRHTDQENNGQSEESQGRRQGESVGDQKSKSWLLSLFS